MIVQLPGWLSQLRHRPMTRRRRPRFAFTTESLESRTLLAGNVTAVVEDGNLRLTGDEADNSVEVTVVDGDIVVQGLEDTTINGSSDPFVAFMDTTTIAGDLHSELGDGADTLRVTGPLTITGSTHVDDTSEASQVGITDATFTGAVHITTGPQGDAISIAGATLGSSLTLKVGDGDNQVSVFNSTVTGAVSVTAGGFEGWTSGHQRHHGRRHGRIALHERWGQHHDEVWGQDGLSEGDHEHFEEHHGRHGHKGHGRLHRRLHRKLLRNETGGQNDIVIEDSTLGSFSFHTGRGADNVIVKNSTIDGRLHGWTGSGDDFVMFDEATVTGTTGIGLSRGDDKLVTQNANTFEGMFWADGSRRRNDAMQISDETVFNDGSWFRGFDSSTVSEMMIQMRGTDTLAEIAELRMMLNGVAPAETLMLTVDTSMNDDTIESNDTLVTTRDTFTIMGQTAPGATVDVAAGTNGAIDLGSTTADMDGNYSIDVPLLEGGTTIMVTSMTDDGGFASEEFNLHRAVGSVVRFASSAGTFDVELLNDDAPVTIANFESYFTDYINSFIHRAGTGTGGVPSVVQGGGFFLDGTDLAPIATNAPIANEFNAANSNLAGTLSTALSGDGFGGTNPNSATSQWFFNLVNNQFLDANRHTVFGRIIGSGLEVLEAIQALPTFDIAASVESPLVNGVDPTNALTNVPLDGYQAFSQALPGTVSIAAGSIIVTGTGTNFTTTLEPGERIQINGVTRAILEVNSDTMLTLTSAPAAAVTGATVFVNPIPVADELVLFSSIVEVLPAP